MFDDIASDWKNKRKNPWTPFVNLFTPSISRWMQSYQSSDPNHLLFVDLGSGSGRHSDFFSQYCSRLVDLDQSRPMIRKNGSSSEKLQADLTALPFRPKSIDGLLAVASLHHIPGFSNRKKTIMAMDSIVRAGGFVCITVWRFKQKKFMDLYREYLHQLCASCVKSFSKLDSDFKLDSLQEFGDVEVPWKLSQKSGNVTVQRFYHLFRAVEFRKLVRGFSHRHIVSFGPGDKKNNNNNNNNNNKNNKTNFFFFGLKQASK
ncbi:MAG: class I SAM-dependent methyltransferase [Promethearchaeota archaeon]